MMREPAPLGASQKPAPLGASQRRNKGLAHLDYVVAISLMIILLVAVVGFLNTFFSNLNGEKKVSSASAQAASVMSNLLRDSQNITLRPFDLGTRAYRMYIILNNTNAFYKNQSLSAANQPAELVVFNYTHFGFAVDVNSTAIYNETNASVSYNINGYSISFAVNMTSGSSHMFTVYFDDDSNFTSRSVAVNGFDNITETIFPAEDMLLAQYKKLMALNSSSYAGVKNLTGLSDFRFQLVDASTNQTFLNYGDAPPGRGNVVALQRHVLYQNSTAGVRAGKAVIQVW